MRILYIIALLLSLAFQAAKAEVNVSPYPSQRWRLSVDFHFSPKVVVTFLNKTPSKDDFVVPQMLHLLISEDGAIIGPRKYMVLMRKLSKHIELGSGTISYLPLVDRGAIYSNACAVLESSRYANSFSHTNPDESGTDITIDLQINGRTLSATYANIQPDNGLPAGVSALFALLRRNLPVCYGGLFDYLNVAKLPKLNADEANEFGYCPRHQERLRIGTASIVYGLIYPQKIFIDAQETLYPNANSCFEGGCCSEPDSPKTKKVLYCSSCRKAQAEWNSNYVKSSKQSKTR